MRISTINMHNEGALALKVSRGETCVWIDVCDAKGQSPVSFFVEKSEAALYERAVAAFNAVMAELDAPAPRAGVDPMFTATCESDGDAASYVAGIVATTGA